MTSYGVISRDARSDLTVVAGRITVADSDRGVPDLIVEAHHVKGDGGVERLGSGMTASQGTFTIEPAPRGGLLWLVLDHGAGWNLRVTVLAPERGDLDHEARLLFASEVRPRARGREEFRI